VQLQRLMPTSFFFEIYRRYFRHLLLHWEIMTHHFVATEWSISQHRRSVLFTPAGLQGFADFLVTLYANSTYYLPLIGSVFSEMLNGERYIGDMHIMIYFAGLSLHFG